MPVRSRVVAIALALAALTLLASCSRDRPDRAAREPDRRTAPVVRLEIAAVDDNGTKPPDEATLAGVRAALDRWVASAVVGPLFTGKPAGDLSALFTAAAHERLADPSVRSTLVDEGLPPASKAITTRSATATLSSVAGPDEVVALVAARVDLQLRAVGPSLDVDVAHYGDLVFVPEADGWKIESFALRTTRDSREAK